MAGRTKARGYSGEHARRRKQWAAVIAAGHVVVCRRCGRRIWPGTAWDLGHQTNRVLPTYPEHAYCNRAAGGRKGTRAMINKQKMIKENNINKPTIIDRW